MSEQPVYFGLLPGPSFPKGYKSEKSVFIGKPGPGWETNMAQILAFHSQYEDSEREGKD
ncbi:hypothetical protein CAY60_020780 [Shouchella clausii]|uniref:hypothetical protein n=1 Tax=Shouchella TaxID=2893057 RepID=UPI0004E7A473|nr:MULTISPECIES: hypothetical protein [Shouchella]ALA55247.1 hypothetical protein DB29_0P0035 [Shouchella clausii]MBU3266263.1 hypothetical protein [Shouchella clausii]MBU3509356.1 hypothetical protein [Shouchella clausii]MDP0462076.1 hypothetical protein [Shouchella rhizosphaerae]MDP5267737.1 hypothetical protein [Shouchella clausii]